MFKFPKNLRGKTERTWNSEMSAHKCRRHAGAEVDVNIEVCVQADMGVNADTIIDTEVDRNDVCM